jgi:hypothetical protein
MAPRSGKKQQLQAKPLKLTRTTLKDLTAQTKADAVKGGYFNSSAGRCACG